MLFNLFKSNKKEFNVPEPIVEPFSTAKEMLGIVTDIKLKELEVQDEFIKQCGDKFFEKIMSNILYRAKLGVSAISFYIPIDYLEVIIDKFRSLGYDSQIWGCEISHNHQIISIYWDKDATGKSRTEDKDKDK